MPFFRHSSKSGSPEVHESKIYVGDRVRMKNATEGSVTCMGPKEKRPGVWLRLAYDKSDAKDSVKWVPMSRVEGIMICAGKIKMTVGDRVLVKKAKLGGTIRYVGQLHYTTGIWYGVELDAAHAGKGKHNGTVKGKYYYECARDRGMFYGAKHLSLEESAAVGDDDESRKAKKKSSKKSSDDKKKRAKSPEKVSETAGTPTSDDSKSDEDDGSDEEADADMVDEMSSSVRSGKGDSPSTPVDTSDEDDGKKKSSKRSSSFGFFKRGKKDSPSSDDETGKGGRRILKEKPALEGFLLLCDDPTDSAARMRAEIAAGKPKKRKITLKGYHKDLYEDKLGPIMDAEERNRQAMFRQKLHLCRAMCQFTELTKVKLHMIEKKERILAELSDYVARSEWFEEDIFPTCLTTIRVNLFRPLPFRQRPPQLFFLNDEVFDKDTNFEDPAWRHLKLVYDLVWRVINTQKVTPELMQAHMEGEFMTRLVNLLASDDQRERAYLMMIIHKIYGRCLKLRPHLINLMCRYLYRMIYTDEFNHYNGIVEILQIVCAIIPGLAVPVKKTWKLFLQGILVPLHKVRGLKKFWEQLTQCCVNYVAKDPKGASMLLSGLLRYWPKQSPQKEEIFIMETVNIINVLINHPDGFAYEDYSDLLIAASHRLTHCMLSTRQPVAERAIAAWKETSMQSLVDMDRKRLLPKLAEAFHRNRTHTNQQLRRSSATVEAIYRSRDQVYWKDMEVYLTKKAKKEKDALTQLEFATLIGTLPPFPYSSKGKKIKPVDEDKLKVLYTKVPAPSDLDKPGDRLDSFRYYELSHVWVVPNYSAFLHSIQRYERDVAEKKKKRKHLTEADKEARRRARWTCMSSWDDVDDSGVQ
jgi:serine/threonine-protein phosphatase 2A regulatory subunit B'